MMNPSEMLEIFLKREIGDMGSMSTMDLLAAAFVGAFETGIPQTFAIDVDTDPDEKPVSVGFLVYDATNELHLDAIIDLIARIENE